MLLQDGAESLRSLHTRVASEGGRDLGSHGLGSCCAGCRCGVLEKGRCCSQVMRGQRHVLDLENPGESSSHTDRHLERWRAGLQVGAPKDNASVRYFKEPRTEILRGQAPSCQAAFAPLRTLPLGQLHAKRDRGCPEVLGGELLS